LSLESKSVNEGYVGSAAQVIFGSDHAANETIYDATRSATSALNAGGAPIGTFGSFSGGSLRYNSGSHVDVDSVAYSLGASYGLETSPGRLTLGLFVEYGLGSYDTYNSFPTTGDVLGHGETSYLGAGLLARFDFSQTSTGSFYTELTARFGQVENEYWSDDLIAGQRVSYDTRTPYFGLHVGVGYVFKLGVSSAIDLYGKYFWNHQNANDATLTTGDLVSFDAVNSHRVKVGARYVYSLNEYLSPYVGASFEQEFAGTANSNTNGMAIEAPSIKGGSGMGELGIKFTPGSTSPCGLDLGLQGYTGKRQGITGSVRLSFDF
jgi:outer membrane autotransporter protein